MRKNAVDCKNSQKLRKIAVDCKNSQKTKPRLSPCRFKKTKTGPDHALAEHQAPAGRTNRKNNIENKETSMTFNGLTKCDLVNWPGRIALTVFTRSCNFSCPYCHNAPLVNGTVSESYSEESVLDELVRHRKLYQGLVVSGGEPTLHTELPLFLRKVKELGIPVKLDTNGSNPAMLRGLAAYNLIDYVAMDIKGPDYTPFGAKMFEKQVEESISFLKEGHVKVEFRMTCSKTLTSEEDILDVIAIADGFPLYLQSFDPHVTLDPVFPPGTWTKEELTVIAREHHNVMVR